MCYEYILGGSYEQNRKLGPIIDTVKYPSVIGMVSVQDTYRWEKSV
jgi:hypothetical protein